MMAPGSNGGGEKLANPEYILKVEPTFLVNGLSIAVCKKKERGLISFQGFGL